MTDGTLRPDAGLAWRCVDGEAVLVRPATEDVLVLNPAGSCVWALADGSRTDSEIAAAFAGRAGREKAQAEALAFLAEMESRALLVRGENVLAPAASGAPEPGSEAPGVRAEEKLEVLAGGCDSAHSGNPGLCRTLGSCSVLYS